MILALFALGGLLLAAALTAAMSHAGWRRRYEDPAADLLDQCSSAVFLALAVWIASSWALALAGVLRRPFLVAAAALQIAAAAVWLHRLRRAAPRRYPNPGGWTLGAVAAALAPVLLWTAFVCWRGALLPVYNHDALAYHFPKAVLLARAGRFEFFDVPEARVATWPWNYELLLADTMLLSGSDHFSALVGTFSYVAFGLMSARIAAVWWGGGAHAAFAAAIASTAPIVVLHSGLHKNDLMMAVFAIAAFMWGARWYAAGCRASLILATLALLAAAGTKVSAPFAIAAAAPLLIFGAVRRRSAGVSARKAGRFVLATAAVSPLFGAAGYLADLLHSSSLVDGAHTLGPPTPGYGDWSNVWQYTAMVLIAPFSRSANAVWNPFRRAYWWWPADDVWASHFGALFSILIVLLVPSVWLWRRSGQGAERRPASLAALAAYVLSLPVHAWPIGFFSTYGRFVLFALPFVAAWTASPASLAIERAARRWAGGARAAIGAAIAVFGATSIWKFGVHDAYAPIEWVEYMMDHRDDRTPFVRRNRAASVFDAIAGPRETCAIDVGFDTWIYPAYGKEWTRGVDFLKPTPGETVIPEEATWVLVDRSWNVFFGHPRFTDMGEARFLGRGSPSAADLKVYRQLLRDPRFELVYDDRSQNQAVFRRKRGRGGSP